LKHEIDRAVERGNNYCDYTGGEPTAVPHLDRVIEYALNRGIRSCIITNGVVNPTRLRRLIDSGVDEWLISVHGKERTHDLLVGRYGSREIQLRTVDMIKNTGGSIRINVVMNKFNYMELIDIVTLVLKWEPSIVNFINFNPHHAWKKHMNEAMNIIADLRLVEPFLIEAIEVLESHNIGVNVRYYPMCRMSEEYRRTICNDLHVLFDPYEWCYYTTPRTMDRFMLKAQELSNETENKDEPCCSCDLFKICGGINVHFNRFTNGTMIDKITNFTGDKNDFYWYRKYNIDTLIER